MKVLVRIAGVALVALPLAAAAQSATSYQPPKLVKQGGSALTVPGAGSVMVQVLVKPDGTFAVEKVLKSSNPADDDVALDVARHSTYQPALRNGKAVPAYFDFPIAFSGGGIAAGSNESTGSTAAAFDAIKAGKYDTAKGMLTQLLQAHPDDQQANTLLGVADAFSSDSAGAAAAFDKVSDIPPQYRVLAAQSYAKQAITLANAQQDAAAISAASHAIQLLPQNFDAYYIEGVAYDHQKQYLQAIVALQKAQSLAASAKADDKQRAQISYNLMIAHISNGDLPTAQTDAQQAAQLDPSLQSKLAESAGILINNQGVELANSGNATDAVTRLEAGAAAFPSTAGDLYAQAATIMATAAKPDWKKVKSEADKALAADPNNGRANYIAGIAVANDQNPKGALPFVNKAKASPLYASDSAFAKQVDAALKALNDATKG